MLSIQKKFHIRLLSIVIILLFSASAHTQVKKQLVKGWEVETGYFSNHQPYAMAGQGDKILIVLEELSFDHKPPEGFLLKLFVKQNVQFFNDYKVYRIGRKPNLPNGYQLDHMAEDYASLISSEFNTEVDILGTSTGGQIALSLATEHSELIRKMVIISAAFKLSKEGLQLEKRAAEYFAQQKYGKTMSTLMEGVYDKGLKRFYYKVLVRLFASSYLKKIEYPNDFQVEVAADRAIISKNRLNQIKVPVLVITGKKDLGYSFEDVKKTVEDIPDAKLLSYEKYGHDLYGSNYSEVNIAIKNFLRESP